MKKITIVFDHPYGKEAGYNEPHNRSFTSALLVAVIQALEKQSAQIDLIDLHQDQFNPVMTKTDLLNWRTHPFVDTQSQNYFEGLQNSDEIIMLFPIWWEMMPAMTKGFIDKVFAKGQIQEHRGITRRLFSSNTKVRVLTVSGAPTWIYKVLYGNPVGRMLKRGVFRKSGVKNFKWHNFNAEDVSPKARAKMLNSVAKYI
jgi:NAD(P)H dehydrogenase (quinone)